MTSEVLEVVLNRVGVKLPSIVKYHYERRPKSCDDILPDDFRTSAVVREVSASASTHLVK